MLSHRTLRSVFIGLAILALTIPRGEGVFEGVEKFFGRSKPEAPEQLDKIASIYARAAADAKKEVAAIKQDVSNEWSSARSQIANIYRQAAQQSQDKVNELLREANRASSDRKSTPSQTEEHLELLAEQIERIYSDANARARARAQNLEQNSDEELAEFRRRIGSVYEAASREADAQIEHLRRLAHAHHAALLVIERPVLPQRITRAVDTGRLGERLTPGAWRESERKEQGPSLSTRMGETLEEAGRGIKRQAGRAGEYVREKSEEAMDTAKAKARSAAETAKDYAKDLGEGVTRKTKQAAEAVSHKGEEAYIGTRQKLAAIYRSAVDSAMNKMHSMERGASDTWDDVKDRVAHIWHEAGQSAENQAKSLLDSLGGTWTSAKHGASEAAEYVEEGAESLLGRTGQALRAAKDSIADLYHRGVDAARDRIGRLLHRPGESWSSTLRRLSQPYEDEFDAIEQRLAHLRDELRTAEQMKERNLRAKERVRRLEQRPGESWEDTRKRIHDAWAEGYGEKPETGGGVLGGLRSVRERVFDAMLPPLRSASESVTEAVKHPQESLLRPLADTARQAVLGLKPERGSPSIDRLREKIVRSYRDLQSTLDSKIYDIHLKPAQNRTAWERAQLRMAEAVTKGLHEAETAAYKLESRPNESWDAMKRRVSTLFEDAVYRAEHPRSSVSDAWERVKHTARGAWQSLTGGRDVEKTFHDAIERAHREVAGMTERPGETWDERRHRMVAPYKRAVIAADDEFEDEERRVFEAAVNDEPARAEDVIVQRLASIYSNSLNKAVVIAESMKEPDTMDKAKYRLHALFNDAIDTAELYKDSGAAESTLESFRTTLEMPVAKAVGLIGIGPNAPSYLTSQKPEL